MNKTIVVGAMLAAALAPAVRAAGIAARQESACTPARVAREITWQTDLKAALAQARAEHKLVFWAQLLGRIDGGL